MEPTVEQLTNLTELAATVGVIKRTGPHQYGPVKIAYHPYTSTRQQYDLIQAITKVWQKLLFVTCADGPFFDKLFQIMAKDDPLRSNFLKIRKLKAKCCEQCWFNYPRCDYMIGQDGNPKLIQINLLAVSMTNHSQNYQEIKRLTDHENSQKYIDNKPNDGLVQSIAYLYEQQKLTGIFLMVVQKGEKNIIQQRGIELGLLRLGIRSKRVTLIQATKMLKKAQNDSLFCQNEQVAVVYFRAGYKIEDYEEDDQAIWKVRQLIELSSAIKIPTVTMELFNSKRIQTELSKPEVYGKYLTKEEGQLLQKSIAKQWQFDELSEQQFKEVFRLVENDQQGFVLKPNGEGGGNNFFNQDVYKMLSTLDKTERSKYILMERIKTKPIKNVLICGAEVECTDCDYELSCYGAVYGKYKKLIKNESTGFLIRVKPSHTNEGGIMGGVGSICSWKLQDGHK